MSNDFLPPPPAPVWGAQAQKPMSNYDYAAADVNAALDELLQRVESLRSRLNPLTHMAVPQPPSLQQAGEAKPVDMDSPLVSTTKSWSRTITAATNKLSDLEALLDI